MSNSQTRNSDPPSVNPLEIEAVLLTRLNAVSQKAYAERAGVSESAVSKRKADGYFSALARELAFLGVQVAPSDAVMVRPDLLQSLQTLAQMGLEAHINRMMAS